MKKKNKTDGESCFILATSTFFYQQITKPQEGDCESIHLSIHLSIYISIHTHVAVALSDEDTFL